MKKRILRLIFKDKYLQFTFYFISKLMNIYSLLFLSFYLLIPFHLFSQNVDEIQREADSLYKAQNYHLGAPLYAKLGQVEHRKVLKNNAYYNAACCYALINDKKKALKYLKIAVKNGWSDIAHTKQDSDLNILHNEKEWAKILASMPICYSKDPLKTKIITKDIDIFWKAYHLAEKDTQNQAAIYEKKYLNKGSKGLQSYWDLKIRNPKRFVAHHKSHQQFYKAIKPVSLRVKENKQTILGYCVKFKSLYADAIFPDIYFVIGCYTAGGTESDKGLLIGTEISCKTPDIPTSELSTWEKNVFADFEKMPIMVIHELIHAQQHGMKNDTTLLKGAIIEGMADFLSELVTGKTINERQHLFAKGKEKEIWADFKAEMYLDRSYNWIGNSDQETPTHPADLGYWVGYQICKSYYEQAKDKEKAIWDMFHIQDYRLFLGESKWEEKMR